MQKITPCLWFEDRNGEEAMNFYISVFKDGRILSEERYSADGPDPNGTVLTATFEIRGQEFMILNGGPYFKFNEALSFYVDCKDQQEVDYFWDALTADGGEESQCGWLKDKFGVSWQIVPRALMTLLGDPDRQKAGRVMQAMLQMQKIDVAGLQRAYDEA